MRYTQHDKTIPSGLRYHGKTPQGPKPANCRPNTTTIDRRALLKASIAGMTTSFFIMPRHVVGGSGQVPPSEKVNLALVGAGGQGRTNVRALFDVPEAQFISVADPAESFNLDRFYYKGVAGRDPIKAEIEKHYAESTPNYRVATYVNFREMLDREKSIDAVLCATPDHLHAFVTSHALRAGKHVFCEKPLTHNIWEARQVAKIERETHLATQMGNIGHSTDDMRKTVEYLQAGAIGAVREVHAWVPAGRWNPALTGRPDPEAIPNGLNWDLWLGPRNTRPYSSAYAPVGWRDFWDFGGSNIGDFACHDLDAATWALDLKTPETIEAYPAGPHTEDIGPHGSLIRYTFAARGDQPPLKIHWYDGGLKPTRPVELDANFELPRRGILFVGDKGVLFCGGAGGALRLFPQHRSQEFTPPAPTIKRSQGHHRDWVLACKGGEPASSNFEYGARLTELALLGVLALRSGRTIEWDGDAMQAKGFPEAEQWIKESIRPGWEMA